MVLPSHFPLLAGEGLVHFEQGRLFGVEGSAYLSADLKITALIKREGRTRRWSSLHTSLPLRREGLAHFEQGRLF